MAFERIPAELQVLQQWVLWKYENVPGSSKPTKVPYSVNDGNKASVDRPECYGTFAECVSVQRGGYGFDGIGFVLTENDPYTIIDLDETTDASEQEFHKIIAEKFAHTYSEVSPSGRGLHIVLKGELVPTGKRARHCEIYSSGRYMAFTGDVYSDNPICDYSELALSLWYELGASKSLAEPTVYIDRAQEQSDEKILEIARNAENGEKFQLLWESKWIGMYPSQSEADFALIDILAYYTQNREQIVRLFHQSLLGKRGKAKRKDYVARMLNRAFDKLPIPLDLTEITSRIKSVVDASKAQCEEVVNPKPKVEVQPFEPIASKPVLQKPAEPETPKLESNENELYQTPPGLVGQIQEFVYKRSPRPVKEIALAAALGLMAGVCGRAWNVSGTGLNSYILLLAPTGTGKEAMATGIEALIAAVAEKVPTAENYIGPGEISSVPAVLKYMNDESNSFVQIVGEFGLHLRNMSLTNGNSTQVGLRRFLLDVYNKSGEGQQYRPQIYSNREKNTKTIHSPGFTILAESTPEKYYEIVNDSMISEGLTPRFTAIEYRGTRPLLNKAHSSVKPSTELVEAFGNLVAQASMLNNQNRTVNVRYSPEAAALFEQYDIYCTSKINNESEASRQLWNRAQMKAIKLAALVAVGIESIEPVITEAEATWAIRLTEYEISQVLHRFQNGMVGNLNADEGGQLNYVQKIIREFFKREWKEIASYLHGRSSAKFWQEKVIPYGYLQVRCAVQSVFRNDRLGPTAALQRAITLMVARGDLAEVPKQTMFDKFRSRAKGYVLENEFLLKGESQ